MARASPLSTRPIYLSAHRWEIYLRQYARQLEKDQREREREFAKSQRAATKRSKALLKAAKRTSGSVAAQFRKTVKNEQARLRRVGRLLASERRTVEAVKVATPTRTLSYINHLELQLALAKAAASHPGKDMPAGLGRFLEYRKPATARQWINFYVYDFGDEPDWIDIEDIEDYYGS